MAQAAIRILSGESPSAWEQYRWLIILICAGGIAAGRDDFRSGA
jgi:hypothetical protein